MNMFHRKAKWQRVMEKAMTGTADSRVARAGAGTVAGLSVLTALSAVVSSRRKARS